MDDDSWSSSPEDLWYEDTEHMWYEDTEHPQDTPSPPEPLAPPSSPLRPSIGGPHVPRYLRPQQPPSQRSSSSSTQWPAMVITERFSPESYRLYKYTASRSRAPTPDADAMHYPQWPELGMAHEQQQETQYIPQHSPSPLADSAPSPLPQQPLRRPSRHAYFPQKPDYSTPLRSTHQSPE
ncbi:hypothetical protein IWW47_001108 [Coemansia sp. RSA 2052]|nr:hypothetical protein IWW47_001108 [Coemansia sp. RSA 2052]